MLKKILKIWQVSENWEVKEYIEKILSEHLEVLDIFKKNWFIVEKIFFEEILRFWWIKFKVSNKHQFNEISNIPWTEILLWIIFKKDNLENKILFSHSSFSQTL